MTSTQDPHPNDMASYAGNRLVDTEVLVIGGGATGTGVFRDLTQRGFDTVLVEKRDLTHGTTGRYHGLLHSGGRYVVKDPQTARECIDENRILRKIMPHCIEDTGGFFVVTPWDEPGYAERFLVGCHQAGIPIEEVPVAEMLRQEPLLNPKISRCYRVPDGGADSFLAAHVNVAAAKAYGARAFMYHEVIRLLTTDEPGINPSHNRVTGVLCHDLVKDETVAIHADLVVNASGAWAGVIGATAGIEIQIRPGKGTMVAVSHRIVNTVINRCKMPSDGDILVPAHTVAIIGTTDEHVPDPDQFAIEPWEVRLMLEEGEKLVPGFKDMRMLRAWAGVRPLYQETQSGTSRDITRAFVLLDHQERDGVEGLVTITSGKWTTYRKMAEVTVDLVCEKLGTQRECRTHLETLPDLDEGKITTVHHHRLGQRLAHIENERTYGDLICECELATRQDIVRAITQGEAQTLDDIRRDVRLGMGPCQGGFCTFRAAGILHDIRQPPVEETNAALADFLQERWKGLLPVLWGSQLRQERLDELINLNVLNIDHLPGANNSPLGPINYAPGKPIPQEAKADIEIQELVPAPAKHGNRPLLDVLVIGGGLAGLVAAWRAAIRGKRVRVAAKGWGATHWGSGCIDVLGYAPSDSSTPVESPAIAINDLIAENPEHPYALAGLDRIDQALREFQDLCARAGYPLVGSLERNWFLPSATGAIRPTCLAPKSMVAGDLNDPTPILLVGFQRYADFYPELAAANLRAQGVPARGITIDIPSLRDHHIVNTMVLGRAFDKPEFRAEVIRAVKGQLGDSQRVGFPGVLGLDFPLEAFQDLENKLGSSVFEIPTLPPSIPGIRLYNILVKTIRQAKGRVNNGMEIISASTSNGRIHQVESEAAARRYPQRASKFILATGGFLGGGFTARYDGQIVENVFKLPVSAPQDPTQWFAREFLSPLGHPIFKSGLQVNRAFQPVDKDRLVIYKNLYTAGATLGHGDFTRQRSLEGVALVTAYIAGEQAGT